MPGQATTMKRSSSALRLSAPWQARVEAIDHAFQPIVSIHTGKCYGYECLLRDIERAGFSEISAFFDAACQDRVLHAVEDALRTKAFRKFQRIPHHASVRLFINIDNRCFEEAGGTAEAVPAILRNSGLPLSSLCLEISEQHPLLGHQDIQPLLLAFRQSEAKIALDDFGTGFSGLQALFYAEPDIIKIDRFFITDMEHDAKKKIFVTTMVNAAHLLGALVIAEGIETQEEFHACRDIGCDFVQGFFIQHPEQDPGKLRPAYPLVEETILRDRHRAPSDRHLIDLQIEPIQPIPVDTPLIHAVGTFRENPQATFLPVVNARLEPQGILREHTVKAHMQERPPGDGSAQRSFSQSIRDLVTKCPIADIHSRTERIAEALSMYPSAEGVLIVKDMQYLGFLSARALSRMAEEKVRANAQDCNPLSHLPGTYAVHRYLAEVAEDAGQAYLLAYFDFDGFRLFNDCHGFQEGDRAIRLFAEGLKLKLQDQGHFLGHSGGSGFMVGFRHVDYEAAHRTAVELVRQFRHDMESHYRPQERQMGFVMSVDHDGQTRRLPLLRVSAALLNLPKDRPPVSLDRIMETLVNLKRSAQTSSENLASASMRPLKARPKQANDQRP